MPLGLMILGAAILTTGTAVYEGSQQQEIENQGLDLAKNTAAEQENYNTQLQQLISNPSSFFASAPYQAAFAQGTAAVQRGQAAIGNPAGPGQAAALQAYGQSFGAAQLSSQEGLLASLSGVTAPSSPSSSLNSASSASAASAANLSGGLGALQFLAGAQSQPPGYTAQDLSLYGQTSPSMMSQPGGYTINTPGQ